MSILDNWLPWRLRAERDAALADKRGWRDMCADALEGESNSKVQLESANSTIRDPFASPESWRTYLVGQLDAALDGRHFVTVEKLSEQSWQVGDAPMSAALLRSLCLHGLLKPVSGAACVTGVSVTPEGLQALADMQAKR